MDKTILSIQKWLLFLYLAFFPFGQLFKLVGLVHPTDVILITLLGISMWKKQIPKQLLFFTAILVFSFIFGSLYLKVFNVVSAAYLVRLVAYINLALVLSHLVKHRVITTQLLYNSLIAIATVFALFGWTQYLLFPDLRQLYWFGWDDHLGRLVGTFLDPGFMGVMLVLAFALVKNIPLKIFFLITLLLTYSRASFLSLAFVLLYVILKTRNKVLLGLLPLCVVGVLVLPTGVGEGVNLLRTKSIELRLENYQESVFLIKESPIFGFGFNTICEAKAIVLDSQTGGEHGCGGFDNSFLFLFATTGLVGVIATLDIARRQLPIKNEVLVASIVTVGIHSLFHNTFFYPWVMGWLAMVYTLPSSRAR